MFHSELNKINAAHNTIPSGWIFELQKRSTPAAYNREIYSATWDVKSLQTVPRFYVEF
jgi:hypothetical protein